MGRRQFTQRKRKRLEELARLAFKAQQHRELQRKLAWLRACDPVAIDELDGVRRHRIRCPACSCPYTVSTSLHDYFRVVDHGACPVCGHCFATDSFQLHF